MNYHHWISDSPLRRAQPRRHWLHAHYILVRKHLLRALNGKLARHLRQQAAYMRLVNGRAGVMIRDGAAKL
jgi:hypothetical protein